MKDAWILWSYCGYFFLSHGNINISDVDNSCMRIALFQSLAILPLITRCLSPSTLFFRPLLRLSNKIKWIFYLYFDTIPSYFLFIDFLFHQLALFSLSLFPHQILDMFRILYLFPFKKEKNPKSCVVYSSL